MKRFRRLPGQSLVERASESMLFGYIANKSSERGNFWRRGDWSIEHEALRLDEKM